LFIFKNSLGVCPPIGEYMNKQWQAQKAETEVVAGE
jgi:hypothetical protein